jgi:acetamidase/formamidase
MTHHHLHSSPETCNWGFFEANLKPVLTIASGDEVTIDTVSGGPDVVPDRGGFHVPPELDQVHANNERMLPGHILTGPVATRLLNIPLDRERMVGRLPWGLDLPLKPFFGVMGVAPPPAWGRISSLIPRAMGGNLDNKELTPGANCICRCSWQARCSPAATAMACRATARSASPRSRLHCRAASG